MEYRCRTCGAILPESDEDRSRGYVRCSFCATLTDVVLRTEGGVRVRARPPVPMPKGISFAPGPDFVLVRRWFTPKYIPMAIFSAFSAVFFLFFVSVTTAGGATGESLLANLLPVAVVGGFAYFTAAGFLNRTRITASGGRITVRHGPLPWTGNLEVASPEIRQLFTRGKVTAGKHGPSMAYEVVLVDSKNQNTTLLGALESAEQALFVEQSLEKHFRIQDKPVVGELRR